MADYPWVTEELAPTPSLDSREISKPDLALSASIPKFSPSQFPLDGQTSRPFDHTGTLRSCGIPDELLLCPRKFQYSCTRRAKALRRQISIHSGIPLKPTRENASLAAQKHHQTLCCDDSNIHTLYRHQTQEKLQSCSSQLPDSANANHAAASLQSTAFLVDSEEPLRSGIRNETNESWDKNGNHVEESNNTLRCKAKPVEETVSAAGSSYTDCPKKLKLTPQSDDDALVKASHAFRHSDRVKVGGFCDNFIISHCTQSRSSKRKRKLPLYECITLDGDNNPVRVTLGLQFERYGNSDASNNNNLSYSDPCNCSRPLPCCDPCCNAQVCECQPPPCCCCQPCCSNQKPPRPAKTNVPPKTSSPPLIVTHKPPPAPRPPKPPASPPPPKFSVPPNKPVRPNIPEKAAPVPSPVISEPEVITDWPPVEDVYVPPLPEAPSPESEIEYPAESPVREPHSPPDDTPPDEEVYEPAPNPVKTPSPIPSPKHSLPPSNPKNRTPPVSVPPTPPSVPSPPPSNKPPPPEQYKMPSPPASLRPNSILPEEDSPFEVLSDPPPPQPPEDSPSERGSPSDSPVPSPPRAPKQKRVSNPNKPPERIPSPIIQWPVQDPPKPPDRIPSPIIQLPVQDPPKPPPAKRSPTPKSEAPPKPVIEVPQPPKPVPPPPMRSRKPKPPKVPKKAQATPKQPSKTMVPPAEKKPSPPPRSTRCQTPPPCRTYDDCCNPCCPRFSPTRGDLTSPSRYNLLDPNCQTVSKCRSDTECSVASWPKSTCCDPKCPCCSNNAQFCPQQNQLHCPAHREYAQPCQSAWNTASVQSSSYGNRFSYCQQQFRPGLNSGPASLSMPVMRPPLPNARPIGFLIQAVPPNTPQLGLPKFAGAPRAPAPGMSPLPLPFLPGCNFMGGIPALVIPASGNGSPLTRSCAKVCPREHRCGGASKTVKKANTEQLARTPFGARRFFGRNDIGKGGQGNNGYEFVRAKGCASSG